MILNFIQKNPLIFSFHCGLICLGEKLLQEGCSYFYAAMFSQIYQDWMLMWMHWDLVYIQAVQNKSLWICLCLHVCLNVPFKNSLNQLKCNSYLGICFLIIAVSCSGLTVLGIYKFTSEVHVHVNKKWHGQTKWLPSETKLDGGVIVGHNERFNFACCLKQNCVVAQCVIFFDL